MGCQCSKWRGRNPDLPSWLSKSLTIAEVAKAIGRTQEYVREHAEELGGKRIHPAFLGEPGDSKVWRFNPKAVERAAA